MKMALAVAKPPQREDIHGWLDSTLQNGREIVRENEHAREFTLNHRFCTGSDRARRLAARLVMN
jgi:hypothetical protein